MDGNKMDKSLGNPKKVVGMKGWDKIAFHSTYCLTVMEDFEHFEANLLVVMAELLITGLGSFQACCLILAL